MSSSEKVASGLFERINLRTASREHVTAEVIPKFTPRADVVVWGERLFRLAGLNDDKEPVYEEIFAYWIPPQQ